METQKERNVDRSPSGKLSLAASLTGGESLKVYIRVRPRLKNEFLKETAAFVDPSVIFTERVT